MKHFRTARGAKLRFGDSVQLLFKFVQGETQLGWSLVEFLTNSQNRAVSQFPLGSDSPLGLCESLYWP